jgi:hypothetical protein
MPGGCTLDTNNINKRCYTVSFKILLLQCLISLVMAILFAFFLHTTLIKYLDIYHTVLELICVFISLSLFFSVWVTYHKSSVKQNILGFGYLLVAAFDTLHTFYYLKLDLNVNSY